MTTSYLAEIAALAAATGTAGLLITAMRWDYGPSRRELRRQRAELRSQHGELRRQRAELRAEVAGLKVALRRAQQP